MGGHGGAKTVPIKGLPAVGGHGPEKLCRYAIGLIELRCLDPINNRAIRGIERLEDPFDSLQPAVDRRKERLLLLADDVRDTIGRLLQFGIRNLHHPRYDGNQLKKEWI